MDLQHRLKKETKDLHDKMEQSFFFEKILLQKLSLHDYQWLMQRFYDFITPCETRITDLPYRSFITNRKKHHWIEQDLQALKISKNVYSKSSRCSKLPNLSGREHVLGYLYVMERTTLGGRVITKMLKNHLKITLDNGGRFFHGYGEGTRMMWNNFCLNLRVISDVEQQNRVIQSARETFHLLYEWMESRTSVNC